MPRSSPRALRATLAALAFAFALPLVPAVARAQAAPGDVYFVATANQRFHYYVGAGDWTYWGNPTLTGTSIHYAEAHDTATVHGAIHVSTAVDADAGTLVFDLDSEMTLSARTGVFHQTYNDLDVHLYVRGPAGTPFTVTTHTIAVLQASRVGGLPGSLQPVNGVASATFEGMEALVPDGGALAVPIDTVEVLSGVSGTEIQVDGVTYSLALHRMFTTRGSLSQALCILGCMTEAASFHSLIDAHVVMEVFSGAALAVPPPPDGGLSLTARGVPGAACELAFSAPAGAAARLELFDVRGRRVARLVDAPASGAPQSVTWRPAATPAGVYFARLAAGGRALTRRFTLLR